MDSKVWIKLHRSVLESQVFTNPKLLQIWIWCLCKATRQETKILVERQVVKLDIGQFICGRKKCSMIFDVSESSFRRYLQTLVDLEMISLKPTNKFTIVTINNYDSYQGTEPSKRGNKQYGLGYYNGSRDKESEIVKIVEDKVEEIISKEA